MRSERQREVASGVFEGILAILMIPISVTTVLLLGYIVLQVGDALIYCGLTAAGLFILANIVNDNFSDIRRKKREKEEGIALIAQEIKHVPEYKDR